MTTEKQKIAVIGAGVAGIHSAYKLQHHADVTIFEAADYPGGHTNTIYVEDGSSEGLAVDTGFIVLNDRTYPLFTQFLEELQVGIRYSDMSFSVHNPESGLQYCSRSLNSIFAQRKNFFNSKFLYMLLEIKKFWTAATEALKDPNLNNKSLKDFLDQNNFSSTFREDFLYPLSAAVWSSSDKQLDSFPALTFLSFFRNHGWLSYADQPRWQTVVGGSCSYVRRFQQSYEGSLKLNSKVTVVRSLPSNEFEVCCSDGYRAKFNKIVFALHADQILNVLQNPSDQIKAVFSDWRYSKNLTVLHTDSSFMPPLKSAWGSWNYRKEAGLSQAVSVTYDMNRLQGLNTKQNYFVTLNPLKLPKETKIIRTFEYTHPIYDQNSIRSQQQLAAINGTSGIWFCGSYCGYGFHEDAVRSAHHVVESIIQNSSGHEPEKN